MHTVRTINAVQIALQCTHKHCLATVAVHELLISCAGARRSAVTASTYLRDVGYRWVQSPSYMVRATPNEHIVST
jgi:hypothetical protein